MVIFTGVLSYFGKKYFSIRLKIFQDLFSKLRISTVGNSGNAVNFKIKCPNKSGTINKNIM
ncbi:MAG: hypothetical protein A2057_07495 [Ignavibacteria bacterium GWA2_35_9]|nr:MAG: hypothetical protein A2057_07495 [Ignavibacteria bacterium GWA2_35_9]OGU47478.1 MAG: hypothetical protein A2000_16440 [Ignavibacteria bacterium GWB2_36_8]OGU50012.1 MAG: hypothetical protein A2080_15760 [Ignavibacteria bacterium GWC2_36_12]